MSKTYKEYAVVSIEPNMINHLWNGDSLDKARKIRDAYDADGVWHYLRILQRDVTVWEDVGE